jgi:hypothetical protein
MPEQNDVTTEIDWKALELYWEEQYEEDYGHLFNSNIVRTDYP